VSNEMINESTISLH